MNAATLNTLHNLHFYLDTMRQIRDAIAFGRFNEFRREFLARQSRHAAAHGAGYIRTHDPAALRDEIRANRAKMLAAIEAKDAAGAAFFAAQPANC